MNNDKLKLKARRGLKNKFGRTLRQNTLFKEITD